jgi:hypothetical protein
MDQDNKRGMLVGNLYCVEILYYLYLIDYNS